MFVYMNKKLSTLEKTHLYLFHGSGYKLKKLSPKQAYSWTSKGVKIKDGKPAVYASDYFQIATFMALINKKNCPKGYWSGFTLTKRTKRKITFSATKLTLLQLKKSIKGYIYIFNKKDFKKIRPGEWASYQSVIPLHIIKVGIEDLPGNIKIKVSNLIE